MSIAALSKITPNRKQPKDESNELGHTDEDSVPVRYGRVSMTSRGVNEFRFRNIVLPDSRTTTDSDFLR